MKKKQQKLKNGARLLFDLLNANKYEVDLDLMQEFSFATGVSTHDLK